MKEKDLTTQFGHWVSANSSELPPFVFEAKIVHLDREKSLGLGKFQNHQISFLLQASGKGIYYKHPDLGNSTPGDGFFFRGEAWVVIFWYMPRKQKTCTIIRVNDFLNKLEQTGKKSVTESEAEEIAIRIFEL